MYRVAHIQGISRFGVKERWKCFQHFHIRPHEEKSGQVGGKHAAAQKTNENKYKYIIQANKNQHEARIHLVMENIKY